ncbi:MAG: dienelactone hydrolase family protein [Armatimonadota bacterium]
MISTIERNIEIQSGDVRLPGMLAIPVGAEGIVLFAHGSGSGRFSPRNQYVANILRSRKLGTLLLDLLEEWESDDRRKVFDIDLLAERLLSATSWIESDSDTKDLSIGYFGASTGAAAALQAASMRRDVINAVVSRGGRPDLAMKYLPQVFAPVLLIVGGDDWPVISMNQEAYENLPGVKEIKIVPGATHLFEEPGKLDEVARLAGDWFAKYLTSGE